MTPLYLHGLPGGASELALGPSDIAVMDRAAPSFAQLAIALPNGPLHLIGFSLGAACALRLAALAPGKVARVTLISGAAPLELGDFLPRMAGASLFRLARSHARLRAATEAQSALARVSPALMLRLLMRGADPSDRALLDEASAGRAIAAALQEGLTQHKAAYLREVAAYGMPWHRHLPLVRAPVTLHHGTADRWAPFDMAETLAAALPHATLHRHEGLGHYSVLQRVLPGV